MKPYILYIHSETPMVTNSHAHCGCEFETHMFGPHHYDGRMIQYSKKHLEPEHLDTMKQVEERMAHWKNKFGCYVEGVQKVSSDSHILEYSFKSHEERIGTPLASMLYLRVYRRFV